MTNIKNNYIVNYLIHILENKFVNIKVNCKCILCSPTFRGEIEEKKTYEYVILLGQIK